MGQIGYIYVLSNEAFSDILKIGKTTRTPQERAVELNTTGVPLPFKVEYAAISTDVDVHEIEIHGKLASLRLSDREFFRVKLSDAVNAISEVLGTEPNPFVYELKKKLGESEGKIAELQRVIVGCEQSLLRQKNTIEELQLLVEKSKEEKIDALRLSYAERDAANQEIRRLNNNIMNIYNQYLDAVKEKRELLNTMPTGRRTG
jgi:hypothetical protein